MTKTNKRDFLKTLDRCLRDVNADLGSLEQQAHMLETAAELEALQGEFEDLQEDVALWNHRTSGAKRLTPQETGKRLASITSGIVAIKERFESLRTHR